MRLARVYSCLHEGGFINNSEVHVDSILGKNEKLNRLYSKEILDILLCTYDKGKDSEYLGYKIKFSDSIKNSVATLFDYILKQCEANYNKYKQMDAYYMGIFQGGDRVFVEVKFIDAPTVMICFKEGLNGFEYETSLNYKVGIYNHSDLESLLIKAIKSVTEYAKIPIHSIECWTGNPINRSMQVSYQTPCYIGFGESSINGEYTIAFLVG